MPELPEVETVRLGLLRKLPLPLKLEKVVLYRGDLRNVFRPQAFKILQGQSLVSIARRSKYLLFRFESGGFLSHLGMTGHWRIEQGKAQLQKHDHVELQFSGGWNLIYNDPRRFGFFDSFREETKHPLLRSIGPEPLDKKFTGALLKERLKGRSGPIKNILMNQSVVAGVGNIYASEVLFKAGVKPSRKASNLKQSECEKLVLELKTLLKKSIQLGGSSFDDFRHVSGEKGGFQNHFWVYNRAGEPCRKCGDPIRKKVFSGRSTYWCGICQK